MIPSISVEICRHWLIRLALERYGGGSRRSVVIISTAFTTVGEEDLHEILIMGEELLQIFAVPVAVGGAGIGGSESSGDTLFAIFFWCWNSAVRRITMSSTRLDWSYPT